MTATDFASLHASGVLISSLCAVAAAWIAAELFFRRF